MPSAAQEANDCAGDAPKVEQVTGEEHSGAKEIEEPFGGVNWQWRGVRGRGNVDDGAVRGEEGERGTLTQQGAMGSSPSLSLGKRSSDAGSMG